MDSFFVLLALLFFGGLIWIVVAPIYLMIRMGTLTRRIEELESRLRSAGSTAQPDPGTVETPAPPVPDTAPNEVAAKADPPEEVSDTPRDAPAFPPAPPPSETPERFVITRENQNRLKEWLAQNWVSVVAVLSLTFAGIFFVR